MEKPNVTMMAAFIKANAFDCGHHISTGLALLLANIIIDYLALCGIYIEED